MLWISALKPVALGPHVTLKTLCNGKKMTNIIVTSNFLIFVNKLSSTERDRKQTKFEQFELQFSSLFAQNVCVF